METSLLITLQNYGFSEKEAKVYLTILELGTSIASTVARRSEIKRVTVYTILDDLKRKGIVNETTKEDVKYYSVISPDILLKQLEQKYESFKEKVPELLALADKFGNRPKVQFFEGFEGIKKMYNDLLIDEKSLIRSFLGRQEMDKELIKYFDTYFIPQRYRKKIWAHVILSEYEGDKEYHKKNNTHYTKTILIKQFFFKLYNEIIMYGGNKIMMALYSGGEMSGIVIHSQKLHDTLVSIFEALWATYKNKKTPL